MNRLRMISASMVLCVGMLLASEVRADTIELANGDVLNGKVISLNAKQLVLKSELLGELKLDRSKVSAIHLGDKPILRRNPAPAANSVPAKAKPALDPAVQNVLNSVPSSDEVLKQLQGGVDPQMVGALQTKFPLLNNPEAKDYFNDKLTGLMTGRLNIGDIRKDAVKARDQLKDLQDELGPDGAALNGYMSILNKFIRETDPPPNVKKPTANLPPQSNTPPKKKTPATFPPKG